MRFVLMMLFCVAALSLALSPACAADEKPPVQWTVKDSTGKDVSVPAPDKPTIVAFLRAAQAQSNDALQQLTRVADSAQVIIILSGETPADAVAKFVADNKIAWPIVLDPDYALSGKMSIHVWPTTAVLKRDGKEVAHLAGLPPTYEHDLQAYLEFADDKLDAAALQRRLTTRAVVADSPQQAATRYVIIADALIEREQIEQARTEIERGLKLQPDEISLRLALVRVMLKQKQFDAALIAADALKDAAPAWQVNLLRVEALIGLDRWAEAKEAAAGAIKLNPKPASAYYFSGMVLAHAEDWPHAADAFRRAYETAQAERRR